MSQSQQCLYTGFIQLFSFDLIIVCNDVVCIFLLPNIFILSVPIINSIISVRFHVSEYKKGGTFGNCNTMYWLFRC